MYLFSLSGNENAALVWATRLVSRITVSIKECNICGQKQVPGFGFTGPCFKDTNPCTDGKHRRVSDSVWSVTQVLDTLKDADVRGYGPRYAAALQGLLDALDAADRQDWEAVDEARKTWGLGVNETLVRLGVPLPEEDA